MFSVVITTKNREKYLLRALQSALSNSILPNDIVVVNDGGEIPDFKSLYFGSVNLKVINNIDSKGANYCRNIGIEATETEFVFLLDDDDAFTENSFKNRLEIIKSDENIGACFTGIKIVRSSDLNETIREVLPANAKCYFNELLNRGNVLGSTSRVVLRKEYFIAAGKFDESLDCLQDYDLWIRIAKVSIIQHDSRSNVFYTVHEDGHQISSKFERYLSVGLKLEQKYKVDIDKEGAKKNFLANIYLRVAISSASTSFSYKCLYAFKSFIIRPSLKSIALLILPFFILKKIYPFA